MAVYKTHCPVRDWGLLQYFELREDDYEHVHCFSNVLVGIDYHAWPSQLSLSYDIQNHDVLNLPLFKERLKAFLEYAIKPCFFTDEMRNPLYQKYFCECIASFLFSDAKYVDDMLFLDVFSCHFDRLKKVLISGAEALTNPRGSRMKYSDKHVYQELIETLSSPSPHLPAMLQGLTAASPYKVNRARWILEKLVEGCTHNHFKDSPLYPNCQNILSKLPV